jgi:hypothetical protein
MQQSIDSGEFTVIGTEAAIAAKENHSSTGLFSS